MTTRDDSFKGRRWVEAPKRTPQAKGCDNVKISTRSSLGRSQVMDRVVVLASCTRWSIVLDRLRTPDSTVGHLRWPACRTSLRLLLSLDCSSNRLFGSSCCLRPMQELRPDLTRTTKGPPASPHARTLGPRDSPCKRCCLLHTPHLSSRDPNEQLWEKQVTPEIPALCRSLSLDRRLSVFVSTR